MRHILMSILVTLSLLGAQRADLESLYEKKDYSGVIALAKTLKSDYDDPLVHILWAKSAEALGKEDEAISAYERVLILDDNNTEVLMPLYKLYVRTSRQELASALAPKLGLQNIKREGSTYTAKGSMVFGYDTNSNMSAATSDINQYFGSAGEGEKGSYFTRLNLAASVKEDLDGAGGWYVQGDIQTMLQNYHSASMYNMYYIAVGAGIGYTWETYKLYIPVFLEQLYYLDTELFDQITMEPTLSIRVNTDLVATLSMPCAVRSYVPSEYYSMNHRSLGVGGALYYLKERSYYYGSLQYERVSALKTNANYYIEKQNIYFAFGMHLDIATTFFFDGEYRYKKAFYDDGADLKNLEESSNREDDMHQLDLKLSHPLDETYQLYISQRWTQNSSNYLIANYEKSVSMFGISASY